MKIIKFLSVLTLIMVSTFGCGNANISESSNSSVIISENDEETGAEDVESSTNAINSMCYPISFIGDAFRNNIGLASVVLQDGSTCVIDENGTPLVVLSRTYYSQREENELDSPDFLDNGGFVYLDYGSTEDMVSYYLFSHNGTLLKHLLVGERNGCEAEKLFYDHYKYFYWISEEGDYNSVSYVLTQMDTEGNTTSQVLPEECSELQKDYYQGVRNYLENGNYEETSRELMVDKIYENTDLDIGECSVREDGSAVIIDYGADDKPYYAYVSEQGVLTSEMTKLPADGACFCGDNILMWDSAPELNADTNFSIWNLETDEITKLDITGWVDTTNSRYKLRAFSEPNATIETGQPRRTNFIRPDGTMLFEKDSYGNTVIEIPFSVPRY